MRTYDRKLYEHEQIEEDSRELLRKLSWQVKVAGGTVAETHLRIGEVDLEIVALAKEIGAGLIVMGCRGQWGANTLMTSGPGTWWPSTATARRFAVDGYGDAERARLLWEGPTPDGT